MIIYITLLASYCMVGAQPVCGNHLSNNYFFGNSETTHQHNYPGEYATHGPSRDQGASTNEIKTISTVIHVLYRNSTDNISDEQIFSGLEVLNEDFGMTNPDFFRTPDAFKPLAADCEIEFCLVSEDQFGNPTSGITRTQIPESFDVLSSYFDGQLGGRAAWDNLHHLNIWIMDLTSLGSGVGGFGQPPSAVGQAFDGVVIDYKYWGRIEQGGLLPPFHLGRTVTHEVGHYLNLEHPWGLEVGCEDGDFVDDTPPQYEPQFACPIAPVYDACTGSGDGLVFCNYMDYTYDACTTMFTHGQKKRMIETLEGPRASLVDGGVCAETTTRQQLSEVPEINIFPNPATDYLQIYFVNDRISKVRIVISNLLGKRVFEKTIALSDQIKISLPDLLEGVYLLSILDKHHSPVSTQRIVIN